MELQAPSAAARAAKPIIRTSLVEQAAIKEGMCMAAIDVVIMAAGKGTRMKSSLPKVLHRLAGRPLLQHVVDCVGMLDARQVVVVTGNGAEQVEAALGSWPRSAGNKAPVCVRQEPQLGTGHAVQQAMP